MASGALWDSAEISYMAFELSLKIGFSQQQVG